MRSGEGEGGQNYIFIKEGKKHINMQLGSKHTNFATPPKIYKNPAIVARRADALNFHGDKIVSPW